MLISASYKGLLAGSPSRLVGRCRSVVYGQMAVRCEEGRARGDPVFDTRYFAPQNFSEQEKKKRPHGLVQFYINPLSF